MRGEIYASHLVKFCTLYIWTFRMGDFSSDCRNLKEVNSTTFRI